MIAYLAVVLLAVSVPASAELPGVHLAPALTKLRFEPRCVLHAVALEMSAKIGRYRGPELAAAIAGAAKTTPRVRLKSETTLDDSLAHEFVHHIQVKYLGYGLEDLGGDDSAEGMAV